MSVRLQALSKRFGANQVIHDLTTAFPSGKLSILLGASGCGKTTTLRCIAGLERPSGGEIWINDRQIFSTTTGMNRPPEQRDLSMVFQSYAIWPHMTVGENVALPLKARGVPRSKRHDLVHRALMLVGLAELESRMATQLSGGQQQRVALARSVVHPCSVVLLDEPLSNLDARLRIQMRQELKALQRSLDLTMIFVTHDQEEAMSIADRIYLFDSGKIAQEGEPSELYCHPASRYVAEFLGAANFIDVSTMPSASGGIDLYTMQGVRLVVGFRGPISSTPDAVCVVRPQDWALRSPGDVGIAGCVTTISFLGERQELRVRTAHGDMLVTTLGISRFQAGDNVALVVDPEKICLLPRAPTS
jgi:iron(III) transport system ATP-binding protein